MLKLRDVLLWLLGVLTMIGIGIGVSLLSGCEGVNAAGIVDGPRAPVRGPAHLDAGFPDTVPGVDSFAADTLRAVSDSSPDAVPVIDRQPLVDMGTALDLSPPPDTRPAARDVLPAPDSAPECPYVAWMPPPDVSITMWSLTVTTTGDPACFTFCSNFVNHLQLAPPRSVTINDKAALTTPNEYTGSWPNAQPIDSRFYVVRIAAGDAGIVRFTGTPGNTTGACP